MLYLEFIDWEDYIQHLGEVKLTHLDVLDASAGDRYQFYIVATQPFPSMGVLAVCSALILIENEPGFITEAAQEKFVASLTQRINQSRDKLRAMFKKAGIRVRAGIFSIEAPPVLRLRK